MLMKADPIGRAAFVLVYCEITVLGAESHTLSVAVLLAKHSLGATICSE
jgi:hypothetical protein